MIEPVLSGARFLIDVARASREPDALHLWWLGQSGFLLQWQGRHILLDPYLSDSLTEKYADTDRPHVRMTALVVPPDQLDFIDVVTSSHNHTDHLDAETLLPILSVNPGIRLVIPEANRSFVAERLGIPAELPLGLDAGLSVTVAGFRLHGVPAAHETIERDDRGFCKFLGYIVECGPWKVYHSGDTVLHEEVIRELRQRQVDVALLPINGHLPERRVAGNLNGTEAILLAGGMGARMVIPCHYEMFEFNTEPPDEFIAAAKRFGQRYDILRCGERWSSDELSEPGAPP